MKKLDILIVGHGFVGKAVEYGFTNDKTNIWIADPKNGTSIQNYANQLFDLIFVCVPTPMGVDGEIDLTAVNETVESLCVCHPEAIVALKSTVIPSEVDKFEQQFSNFVYNPEFLTEKNANEDFVNPFMHVFGGSKYNCMKMSDFYWDHSNCRACPMLRFSAKEASFVKYSINSFLALKVVFWNQMKELIEKNGADYDVVREGFTRDPRIGWSHSMVPGHDGRNGTGSACFSKDIPALIRFSNNELSILREAWNVNCDIRNGYPYVLPREKEQHIEFNKI